MILTRRRFSATGSRAASGPANVVERACSRCRNGFLSGHSSVWLGLVIQSPLTYCSRDANVPEHPNGTETFKVFNSFLVRPTLLPAGGLMTGQRNPSSAFTRLRLVDCPAFVRYTKKHRLDDRLASKRVTGCSASAVLASSSLLRLPGR